MYEVEIQGERVASNMGEGSMGCREMDGWMVSLTPHLTKEEVRRDGRADPRLGPAWLSRSLFSQPIAARLASDSSSSPYSTLTRLNSPAEKSTRPLLPSSNPPPGGASPSDQPILLVAFLISPPLPPPSTTISFSPGEEQDLDFDFEIGEEFLRLEGDWAR